MSKRIPLTKGKTAIVDGKYYRRLRQHSWCYQSPGYAASRINGQLVLMHRLVMGLATGRTPLQVDHRNRDRLDNRRRNLREAGQSDNLMNAGRRSDNSSGYRGVFWHSGGRKWMAQLKYKGRTYYLGLFASKVEAARVYDRKAAEVAGDFANLNAA